jgi:prepilin-type N-terminal cleavage/methylation domain-containing protein
VKRLGNQKGLTLIEVIIALAVFAAIAVSVFIALVVSTRTTASVNENTTAESLTRAELEYIKSCAYDDINNPPNYGDPNSRIPPEHSGYSMTLTAERLNPATYQPLPSGDLGLQKVTVKVYHDNELEVSTESYKVKR